MYVKINNFRGIKTADIDMSTIALISGPNGAGKTSICQAVAAALTGDPLPVLGIKKSGAGVLVRSGTSTGRVELTTDTGVITVTWPAAAVKTTGAPPSCSRFAVGLDSIVAMDDKSRTAFLIDYLGAKPTKDDLGKALAPLALADGLLDKLWDLIQSQGWSGAYSQIKEKGAKLKGQWEQVTNANYGSKLAESWLPDGYSPDLYGASETTLQAIVTDARDSLEAAIACGAVDDSKRGEWETLAALLDERQVELDRLQSVVIDRTAMDDLAKELQDARSVVADAQKHRDAIRKELTDLDNPAPVAHPVTYPCPACKAKLNIVAGKIVLAGEVQQPLTDTNRLNDLKKQLTEAEQTVSEVAKIMDDIQKQGDAVSQEYGRAKNGWTEQVFAAKAAVNESTSARLSLTSTPAGPTASVEDHRRDLAAAELRLRAFQAKTAADGLHAGIELNSALLTHVAPTGVQASVLALALEYVNRALREISVEAGWAAVQIEQDFSFTFGGTMYALCSSAEQYRVRLTVQIAMAKREAAPAVVIDGADIMDRKGRNGLFRILQGLGKPALVGMTIDTMEHVPELKAAGIGRVFWLCGNEAEEV